MGPKIPPNIKWLGLIRATRAPIPEPCLLTVGPRDSTEEWRPSTALALSLPHSVSAGLSIMGVNPCVCDASTTHQWTGSLWSWACVDKWCISGQCLVSHAGQIPSHRLLDTQCSSCTWNNEGHPEQSLQVHLKPWLFRSLSLSMGWEQACSI